MALQKWIKKKKKATSEGNIEERYRACVELAELSEKQKNFEDALAEYKDALNAAEAMNNVIFMASLYRMIGEVHSSMENYDLAVKNQLKYLELAQNQDDVMEEQRALANLGHMYFLWAETFHNPESVERRSCLHNARKYDLLSLEVCESLTGKGRKTLGEMKSRLYLNLGLTMEQLDEKETAIDYFNKSIHVCKSLDIWDTLFKTYISLGSFHQHYSDHSRALENFDKAINVAQHLGSEKSRESICVALVYKADVLFKLPDFRGAKQSLMKAYKMNTESRSEVEWKLKIVAAVRRNEEKLLNTPEDDLETRKSLYDSLGDGCANMKSFSKALEYYHLMLETAEKLGEKGEQLSPIYTSLSQTYKDNKKFDLALKYCKDELNLISNNPYEACKTTLEIAELLEIKEAHIEDILENYKTALKYAQTAKNHKLEARALKSMSRLLKDNKRLSEACQIDNQLESLKDEFGPLTDSERESDDENTPNIGAEICISELSDDEPDHTSSTMRTRKKVPVTKFKRNEKGEFPLHTACINGNLTLVRKLLDQGHEINVRDHNGWLPLHEACNFGYLEIVKELLNRGAAINDKGSGGCEGMTPLLDAACNGNLSVMQLLLDNGASPLMRTNKGETAYDCLKAWRKRYIADEERDLDSDTFCHYTKLAKTLETALKRVGHNPKNALRSPSPTFSSSVRRSQHEFNYSQSQRPGTSTQRQRVDDLSQRQNTKTGSRRSFDDLSSQNRGSAQTTKHKTLRRSYEELSLKKSSSKNWEPTPSSSTSLRRSTEKESHQSTSATKDYKETMKALRRKPVQMFTNVTHETKGPLIDEMETVDDWLVDDIGNNTSNRGVKRRHQFEGEPQRRPNRLVSPPRSNRLRTVSPVTMSEHHSDSNESTASQTWLEDNQNNVAEITDENIDHDEERIAISSVNTSPQDMPCHSMLPGAAPSGSYQVPLSVFGIVRTPVPQQPEHPPPVSQPGPFQICTQILPNTQITSNSIKVRVEAKNFLIPIPSASVDILTVAWLSDEAAKRYYSCEGVEPKLSLTTEDGAMLAPQDPVSVLLPYTQVTSVVTSWKMHPVTERYREICTELQVAVDDHLERCLDSAQTSSCLNLKGCSLDASKMDPVLKASAHLLSLERLILKDNKIGDAGMQTLMKLVIKLPKLRELDLTGNGISIEGLKTLVHQIIEHGACKRLEVLKLCFNRLGRNCISLLSQLLQHVRTLRELMLVSVGLTVGSFGTQRLLLQDVERINVGFNQLGGAGVRALLRDLSVSRVTELGLAHTGTGGPGAVAQWLNTDDPIALRILNLSYCDDEPSEFNALTQSVQRAVSLGRLELTCPEELVKAVSALNLTELRLPGVRLSALPPPPTPLRFSCVAPSTLSSPWASRGPFALFVNNTQ